MEAWLYSSIHWLLDTLALPSVGLSAIFVVALVSATLLPLGSEPAVFGYLQIAADMFWPAVLVATLGNTVGGTISYGMGYGAEKAVERYREKHRSEEHTSELQSRENLVCRLLLEKKNKKRNKMKSYKIAMKR